MNRGVTLVETLIVIVIVSLFAALLLPLIGCPAGCDEGYSEGERIGTVVKCSRKGTFSSTKSWEAEMNLGGIRSDGSGGALANVWKFTVEDDEVLRTVQEALRSQRPVIIKYTQWRVRPGCRSESGYLAREIQYFEPSKVEKK